MEIHFNPADIQGVGIGLAAFLATLLATFLFLSARTERLGRTLLGVFISAMIWAWFGFFYHLVSDLQLARDLRAVSVIGIILLSMSHVLFSITYFSERSKLGAWGRTARNFVFGGGAILVAFLVSDLFGTQFAVGSLDQPTNMVLAPHAGPLMAVIVAYYLFCIGVTGVFLAGRARYAVDMSERRQGQLIFASAVVGLILGGTRFTPWYGFDYFPLIGDVGFPLWVFAALYSIKRYRLLNLQLAAAQLLIFALWTTTFFRMLLNPSVRDALPDIGFFLAVLVLGFLLMRSIIRESQQQREIAAMTIERTKSEFITIAAHQLRTPVAALRWSFNLLGETAQQLSPKQREIVDRGNRAADNMVHLVNDLLEMGQIADGKFRYTFVQGNVGDAVRAEVDLFENIAKKKGVTLDTRIALDVPLISFDVQKLNLAIQNIIDNAVKYTPNGGSVVVSVQPSGDGVQIEIQDTGIGFSDDEKSRVFEKFFRGSRAIHVSPDGSGLGLFIAKTVVEGHGGTLSLTSRENKGSTLLIKMPGRPPTGA